MNPRHRKHEENYTKADQNQIVKTREKEKIRQTRNPGELPQLIDKEHLQKAYS